MRTHKPVRACYKNSNAIPVHKITSSIIVDQLNIWYTNKSKLLLYRKNFVLSRITQVGHICSKNKVLRHARKLCFLSIVNQVIISGFFTWLTITKFGLTLRIKKILPRPCLTLGHAQTDDKNGTSSGV